jgi:hypothetical protein
MHGQVFVPLDTVGCRAHGGKGCVDEGCGGYPWLPRKRWLPAAETITKWGLCGFLLLTHARLHPRIPATKCRAQIVV